LRDHEILLRRYDRHEDGPRRITKRVREASTRYLCRAFLRNIYEKVDVVVTLTREDALYIQKHFRPIGGKIVTVPVAFEPPARKGETDRAASGAVTAVDNGEARDLLFLGNFFHRPNIEALEWFLQKCAPHLEPGFTLHLCGMDGPIRGMQYAEDYIKIVRHGFVEDLESEMGWVRIGVSPVISGGGTRIKTLYLGATGRVVVTTPLGNEGIGFRDGEEAIIRQDGCSMAGELNAIAKDPAERRRLGSNAAKKVEEDFSPERIWNYYRKKVFQQAMEKVG
jgi:glycosyltransferase involved in cell wall biosynthesis